MEHRRELAGARVVAAGLLCFALVIPAWAQPAKRALLIANSGYRRLPPLTAPRQNVEALAPVLAELGFQVSPIQQDLDQAGMLAATRRFTAEVKPGDTVYLFFSGYGMAEESINYLLPVNFDPAAEGPTVSRALQLDLLMEQLENRKAGVRIIVIDASRDCPPLVKISAGRGLASQQGVPASTLLFFPAQPGDVVKDPPAGTSSPFVQILLREMKKPGRTAVQVFSDIVEGNVIARGVGEFYFTPPVAPKERIVQVEVAAKLTPGVTRENKTDLLTYAYIPAGEFEMGCVAADPYCNKDGKYADENPRHRVKISKPFWMSRTEITVGAYDKYLAEIPSHGKRKTSKVNPGDILTDHPVIKVNWESAAEYCKWAGGRLPTEAEWEYAARGGQPGTVYTWGNDWNPEKANSMENSRKKGRYIETTPARNYDPNGWGLYDMAGNAREWVSDTYNPRAYDRPQPATDPLIQESGAKAEHVIRGGSYGGREKELRISARQHRLSKDEITNQTGFRCVLPEAALK